MMKITCYGARGSIPAPSRKGFNTIEYGGNTSCFLVEAGESESGGPMFTILLDMGSGILVAGDDLMKTGRGVNKNFIVLLSHFHWDHIQGGPFSVPLFVGTNTFHFHGFAPVGRESAAEFEKSVESVLIDQQDAPNFPVSHTAMPSKKFYHSHRFLFSETFTYHCDEKGKLHYNATQVIGQDHETLPADVRNDPRRFIKITTIPLQHPNGCLGYKIEYMGDAILYATDDEPMMFLNKEIIKHSKSTYGQPVLWAYFDGQYTAEQLAGMTQGFGHGTWKRCVDLAHACNMPRCEIGHHDPRHDDAKVAQMEAEARAYAQQIGYKGIVEFVREGTVWEV